MCGQLTGEETGGASGADDVDASPTAIHAAAQSYGAGRVRAEGDLVSGGGLERCSERDPAECVASDDGRWTSPGQMSSNVSSSSPSAGERPARRQQHSQLADFVEHLP